MQSVKLERVDTEWSRRILYLIVAYGIGKKI